MREAFLEQLVKTVVLAEQKLALLKEPKSKKKKTSESLRNIVTRKNESLSANLQPATDSECV